MTTNMKTAVYWSIYALLLLNCGNLNAGRIHTTRDGKNRDALPEGIVYEDQTYTDNIKTVELYRSGWRLSTPIRNLGDTSSLVLEFDDLADETTHYTYTLIHCSAEWKPSDLVNTEYLTGLPESEIRDYRYSRNALQSYKHYRLSLPNDDISPKLPGNYLLYVYKEYDQEQPVLTRRFFVVDPKVHIVANAHRTDNVKYMSTAQEVDFTIDYQQLQPDDPRRNFKVTVVQNFNWTTAITNLLPKYIQPGELIYDYEEGNLFQGGSEFRHYDTKSLKFYSDRIREIRYVRPLKHVFLIPDQPKMNDSYEYQEDLNGKYLVKWDDAFDSDTEADYVWMHFALIAGDRLPDTEVYLFGNLTSWKTDQSNRLTFNPDNQFYEIDLLLKQGYYNYSYATRHGSDPAVDLTEIDGNHYETENDYYIFVYYRDIRERFDRLVGLEIVSSVNSIKN